MAQLGTAFDPNSVEPDKGGGGGLHPAGNFEFEIQESDVKANSNGSGQVLKFTAVGIGDENKGLKIFENLNIVHTSAQAQAIGQAQLSALCRAMDFTDELTDSEQLHYRPFWAEIVHEQQIDFKTKAKLFHDDGNPKMRAVVKKYLFEDGEAPTQPAATPPAEKQAPKAPPPAANPPAQRSRPWPTGAR